MCDVLHRSIGSARYPLFMLRLGFSLLFHTIVDARKGARSGVVGDAWSSLFIAREDGSECVNTFVPPSEARYFNVTKGQGRTPFSAECRTLDDCATELDAGERAIGRPLSLTVTSRPVRGGSIRLLDGLQIGGVKMYNKGVRRTLVYAVALNEQ